MAQKMETGGTSRTRMARFIVRATFTSACWRAVRHSGHCASAASGHSAASAASAVAATRTGRAFRQTLFKARTSLVAFRGGRLRGRGGGARRANLLGAEAVGEDDEEQADA